MIAALLIGYSIGTIPTADVIGRLRGHDLRRSGSGNPGTANALRVGGPMTALLVLILDLMKGATAALAGGALAGDAGALAGGVAAVAGQILNPWFRFEGGKGLGVTAGMTLVVWPPGVPVVLPIIAVGARLLRSAGGALLGLAAYLGGAMAWAANDWPNAWGVATDSLLVWGAIGIVVLAAPRFIGDIGQPPPGPLLQRHD